MRRGELTPDDMGGGAVCMAQYTRLFTTVRVPMHGCDKLVTLPPFASNHFVVAAHGHYFKVPVKDVRGKAFSVEDFERSAPPPLTNSPSIFFDIRRRAALLPQGLGVGVFSTLPREEWASVRLFFGGAEAADPRRFGGSKRRQPSRVCGSR
jgi:hypothetical protein